MGLLAQFLKLVVIWLIGAALLGWARLPAAWRAKLAVLAGVTGVLFLVLGMNSEGLRHSPTVAVVVMGTPYVTGHVSASASLSYYLLTAVCLLLGSLGLVAGDELASFLRGRWFVTAVGASLLVTVVRFLLEKAAASPELTHAVGIAWLAPLVGAWFAFCLHEEGKRPGRVAGLLLGYACVVRGAVAALIVAATAFRLGTHYDVSPLVRVRVPFSGAVREFVPGSLAQVLSLGVLPQLIVWPLYTLLTGGLGAWVTWFLLQGRRPPLARARAPLSMPPGSGAPSET